MKRVIFKFKNGDLSELRNNLLEDLSRECFATLFGKKECTNKVDFITIKEIVYTPKTQYNKRSRVFLHLRKEFVYQLLIDLQNRADVDTIIDVHTHPFCEKHACFSSTDNRDENDFYSFLSSTFDNVYFGSIVLSQKQYAARMWMLNADKNIANTRAQIKTQTALENIPSSNKDMEKNDKSDHKLFTENDTIFNRSFLVVSLI